MGAQIEIAQLRIRQYEGNRWKLQRLDLAGIRSLTPVTPLLRPWSWQLAAGLERVPEGDQDRLVGHFNGGGGFAWQLGDGLLGFALATARLEHNPDFGAAISPAAGFDSGLLWRNGAGNLLLEARGDYFHNGEARRRISFAQQFELHDDIGLRLGLERSFTHRADGQTEVQLQLRWYYY